MPNRGMTRLNLTPQPVQPWRLFAMTLTLVFTVEYAVMHLLPLIAPTNGSVTVTALADAFCLAVITAPALWVLAVVPLQRLSESRRQFLGRALTAQEEERRRLTRDLHDGIGQSLTSLMLGVRALEETSTEPAVQQQARDVRQLGSTVHDELRQLVRGLRPTLLEHVGLTQAITRLLDELTASHTVQVTFDAGEQPLDRLTPDIETALYRIVQEAITNAVQHGATTQLVLTLKIHTDTVQLIVRDNGQGFDVAAAMRGDHGQPFGLLSIRERAMLLNGTAMIVSQPGAGTQVIVRIPLPHRERPDG